MGSPLSLLAMLKLSKAIKHESSVLYWDKKIAENIQKLPENPLIKGRCDDSVLL